MAGAFGSMEMLFSATESEKEKKGASGSTPNMNASVSSSETQGC